MRIGNDSNSNNGFDGVIDEIRIWNVARDGADILTHMNHYLSGNQPGLVGYWKLNEGSGSEFLDSSGNNNLGLILDAIWDFGIPLEPTAIENVAITTPPVFELSQNYPNPFNPITTIQFALPNPPLTKGAGGLSPHKGVGNVSLHIYDIIGRLVKTLIDHEPYQPGYHTVQWDGRNRDGTAVGSGVYLYQLDAGDVIQTKRMTLLK
ncbi:MAG: hypothetical protein GY869_19825 [Planctomycetes bacterium]|nr:hypothetical protein [Planctomycetota bacterium]